MKIVLIFALLCLVGVSVQPSYAAQSMTLKVGYGYSEQHPYNQGGLVFKELVEKQTKGRFKVELYPNNILGNDSELTEQTKLGTITGTICGRFEEMGTKLYATGLPFLFRDLEHVEKVMKSPLGDPFFSCVEENGLKMLAWTHSGFRQISNNVRPIRKPEDLKGLKMRTPPLDNIVRTMEAFGAIATPIPQPELYTALKTGVVDGQENPYVNIWNAKWYEVQKYITAINYVYIGSPFVVNLKWWNSLSPEDKQIIKSAGMAAGDRTNRLTKETDLETKLLLAKAGVKVQELTSAEVAAFAAKVGPVYDFYIKKGIVTDDLIKTIQAVK
jgi:tripartite ATP-independent transporter DctP family solute receptor